MENEVILQDNSEKVYSVIKELRELKSEMEKFYATIKQIKELGGETFEHYFGDTDTAYIVLEDECRDFCTVYQKATEDIGF